MSGTLDAQDHPHVLHGALSEGDIFYSTDASGEWVRRRLFKGREFYFTHSDISQDGEIHVALKDGDANPTVLNYGLYQNGTWSETPLGAVYNTTDIVLDSTGNPFVLASFIDLAGSLNLSTNKTGNWETITIHNMDDVASLPSITIDNDDMMHIAMSSTNHELLYGYGDFESAWTWEAQFVGAVISSVDIALNQSGEPNIAANYDDGSIEKILYFYQDEDSGWLQETIKETTSYYYNGTKIAVDPNDNAHVFFCCGGSGGGYQYATNRSGTWETQIFTDYGTVPDSSIVADENGFAHITFVDEESIDGFGDIGQILYYATNMTGDWEFHVVDNRWQAGRGHILHWTSDGALEVVYDSLRSGVNYAVFPPGMTDSKRLGVDAN